MTSLVKCVGLDIDRRIIANAEFMHIGIWKFIFRMMNCQFCSFHQ